MAEIGSGIKISQLETTPALNRSDYTVIVHDGTTYKTELNSIQSFFNQDAADSAAKIRVLENKTNALSSAVDSNKDAIQELKLKTDQTADSLKDTIRTTTETINAVNSDLLQISTDVSSTVNLLSILIENPGLIEMLSALSGGETLSDSVIQAKQDIKNLSGEIEALSSAIDAVIEKTEDLKEYSDAIEKQSEFAPKNLINAFYQNSFNPIITNYINPDYEVKDIYCFGNTSPIIEDRLYLSVDENSGTLLSVEIDSGTSEITLKTPSGINTFSIDGIPIRSNMLVTDDTDPNINVLRLMTKGDSEVAIYTTGSRVVNSDSVLSVSIDGNLLKAKSNDTAQGNDTDLRLLWSGNLKSKTQIEFLANGSNLLEDNLIGVIVPKLKASEIEQIEVSLDKILLESNSTTSPTTLRIAVDGGYNRQNVPLSIDYGIVNENDVEVTDSIQLNEFPRINHTNIKEVSNLTQIAYNSISSITIYGYDDVRNEIVSAYYDSEEDFSRLTAIIDQ